MVNDLRKAILVALALAAVLTACAPAQPAPEQVQSQVETSVAMTVQVQNDAATAAGMTLAAQAPAPTATSVPTLIPLALPTSDPALPTVTPFVVVPSTGAGSSSGSTPAKYSCSWREVKPRTNVFKAGDPIDVVWVITNTGTRKWPSALDLNLMSSTVPSSFSGMELAALEPGDSTTVSFEANAPAKPGLYGMQFKVQGGLCFPALNIEVRRPPDP